VENARVSSQQPASPVIFAKGCFIWFAFALLSFLSDKFLVHQSDGFSFNDAFPQAQA
jgi:hypothetical protein